MSGLRFGVFELDPAAPELRRTGRRVHLQEMPLRVLQMLLEHPNELVTREMFFSRLWPHDESGILDDNLNTAVRKLRLALNDSAHHPRFIETVPKRGYRFVGPVTGEGDTSTEPSEAPANPQSEPAAPGSRLRMTVMALVAVAIIGILTAVLVLSNRDAETPTAAP